MADNSKQTTSSAKSSPAAAQSSSQGFASQESPSIAQETSRGRSEYVRRASQPQQQRWQAQGPDGVDRQYGTDAMNMRAMGQALPDPGSPSSQFTQGMSQQMFVPPQYAQGMPQYAMQSAASYQNPQWNQGLRVQQPNFYSPQMPQGQQNVPGYAYQGHPVQQNAMGRSPYVNQPYVNIPQGPGQPGAFYYHAPGSFSPQGSQGNLQSDARRPSFGVGSGLGVRHDSASSSRDQPGYLSPSLTSGSGGMLPSTLRGPPRKPKQSGHALWVGNLPPSTNVLDLKDYFSTKFTDSIQSVFWIPKSNCAFVNYSSASSCAAAMAAFHDSVFQGLRLVCRLRQTPAQTNSAVQSAPAKAETAGDDSSSAGSSDEQAETATGGPGQTEVSSSPTKPTSSTTATTATSTKTGISAKDRFFIVKSLTVEDLELSVRNGMWATQSHNENSLNDAYQTSENVYLVFSANKSGEYFGYARMASVISDVPAEELSSKGPEYHAQDLPKSISTTATETAPPGRVIDDSARGTIFWEVASDDGNGNDKSEWGGSSSSPSPAVGQSGQASDTPSSLSSWNKAFKVEWVSTNRIPFYRVRGLRNPWNSNREVKIARDGTELEPSVGQRLLSVFHQPVMHTDPMMAGGQSPHANLYPASGM